MLESYDRTKLESSDNAMLDSPESMNRHRNLRRPSRDTAATSAPPPRHICTEDNPRIGGAVPGAGSTTRAR